MRPDTEQRVEDAMKYIHDFHEANGEWPTREDYRNFLGLYSARGLPGVRAAINRGLLWYDDRGRLVPREVSAPASEPKEPS